MVCFTSREKCIRAKNQTYNAQFSLSWWQALLPLCTGPLCKYSKILDINFRRNSGCTYAYYLMQQMLEWNKAEELSQALSLVLAIFHMDLEHLTHSMLLRLMPRLLLSTVHTHMLTDPRGFTLAKLCVLCITGTQTSKIGQKGGFAVVAHFYGFLHLLLNVCAMVTCVLNVCYDNRCPECVMVTCVCWHMSSVCTCCSLPVNQSTLTFWFKGIVFPEFQQLYHISTTKLFNLLWLDVGRSRIVGNIVAKAPVTTWKLGVMGSYLSSDIPLSKCDKCLQAWLLEVFSR